MATSILIIIIVIAALIFLSSLAMIKSWYKKVPQGKGLIRTGSGGIVVAIDKGMFAVPGLHIVEPIDLSVKTVEISRLKKNGLICKDNIRADIKVVFFIRINPEIKDIIKVAQTIGCESASKTETLRDLFEAKFSEALKTVSKRFDFVNLYDNRVSFKQQVIDIIGVDLGGYMLDDVALDYLEQTPIEYLQPNNILDAEGIKKITELTAAEELKANFILREKEIAIKEQDIAAQEAIFEYERQLAIMEERQKKEIAKIKAGEYSEITAINKEEKSHSKLD